MKVVIGLLLTVICAAAACAPLDRPVAPDVTKVTDAGPPPVVDLRQSCTRRQADELQARAKIDPQAALRGAACLLYLAEQQPKGQERLALAQNGRQLAATAVEAWPDSGAAHYLLAYMTGLVAEGNPLRGLELVKIIEEEARLAAALQPEIDHGGPDRMLGELYLRAPGFPVSIGDAALAIEHFRRAIDLDPGFADNRLGLVEALLVENKNFAACKELNSLFAIMCPEAVGEASRRVLQLQQRLCDQLTPR